MLGRRIQREASTPQVEAPVVFSEPALAKVEDLLTREQRVHDDGPLLQRETAHKGRIPT